MTSLIYSAIQTVQENNTQQDVDRIQKCVYTYWNNKNTTPCPGKEENLFFSQNNCDKSKQWKYT